MSEQVKHEGKLNYLYEVRYLESMRFYRKSAAVVFIGDSNSYSDHIEILPSEALSLLTWLKQEEETLKQLASEEEEQQ